MKYNSNSKECLSWNCCDEILIECIDRSQYVQNIRKQLKKKKFSKNLGK